MNFAKLALAFLVDRKLKSQNSAILAVQRSWTNPKISPIFLLLSTAQRDLEQRPTDQIPAFGNDLFRQGVCLQSFLPSLG